MAGEMWHHLQLIDNLESDRNCWLCKSQYWEVTATNAGNAPFFIHESCPIHKIQTFVEYTSLDIHERGGEEWR
jgi:hypothetical protein